jgi:hypothetical protein
MLQKIAPKKVHLKKDMVIFTFMNLMAIMIDVLLLIFSVLES